MREPDALAWLLALTVVAALPVTAAGQDHAHEHEDDETRHHEALHFAHPMISESVSPDRKVRLDWARFDFPGGAENTFQVTGEWSLTRALSVEAAIPYSLTETAPGLTEVAVKLANYAFEERGLLLGYGMAVALPTSGDAPPGDHAHPDGDHAHANRRAPDLRPAPGMSGAPRVGSDGVAGVRPTLGRDHYELEPFLNVGWRSGRWELVGLTRFAVPTAGDSEGAGNTHVAYNASALLHVDSRLQALLEYDGLSEIGEAGESHREGYLSPGLKVRVLEGRSLFVGGAVSIPVTEDESFATRLRFSLFQHF